MISIRRLKITLIILLFGVLLSGCSKSNPTLKFGLAWENGQLIQQVDSIPTAQQIYALYNNVNKLTVEKLDVTIENNGQPVSGSSVIVKPGETSVVFPIRIDSPGKFIIKLTASDKVLLEKEIMVSN